MTPVQNRKGRLDLAILAFGEALSGRFKSRTGIDIWSEGGRELAEEFLHHWGIPREPVNIPLTIARNMGWIPKRKNLRRVG
jgi:hypothetical protein